MKRVLPVLLIGLAVAQPTEAGTFEGNDGHKKPLKTVDGKDHFFKGNMTPGANLKKAKLWGANLRTANLRKANLNGANLNYTNLTRVNLQNTDLRGASLRGANLNESDLSRAKLSGADLSKAILRYATHWDLADWHGAHYDAADPPWWPKGMDPKKMGVLEKKLPKN